MIRYTTSLLILFLLPMNFLLSGRSIRHVDHDFRVYYAKNEKMEGIRTYGKIYLDYVEVLGEVCINGGLEADQTSFNQSLFVNGLARVDGCIVKNSSQFRGVFSASNSHFWSPISIDSDMSIFRSCNIHSIHVENNDHESQTIHLSEGSVVFDSIIFASNRGKVLSSEDSRVYGQIIGAEVVKSL